MFWKKIIPSETWKVKPLGMDREFHQIHDNEYNYLFMLRLKFIYVYKRATGREIAMKTRLNNLDTSCSRFNIKHVSFSGYGMSIIKKRRSWDSLIFIIGIHILVRQHLYIESQRFPWYNKYNLNITEWPEYQVSNTKFNKMYQYVRGRPIIRSWTREI